MQEISIYQQDLSRHAIYQTFNSLTALQHFMRYHVFAVWDFMSLLKSLQRKVTCIDVPWRPSRYPAEMVRLINQIVLGEESDLDQEGRATSHFELYLKAMEEIGAPTAEIHDFVSNLDVEKIPEGARKFVSHNLRVASEGHIVEVAASFFYGREKLIPEMFQSIVDILRKENMQAPTLLFYLERHIEVDGEEHGPLALKCLDHLTQHDPRLIDLAQVAGKEALRMRLDFWDEIHKSLVY